MTDDATDPRDQRLAMPATTPQTAPHGTPLECRVHSGPQAGARSPVPDNDALRSWDLHIGARAGIESPNGHDLMLAGGVAARLRVTRDSDRHKRDRRGGAAPLRVQLIEGEARLGTTPLTTGIDAPWPMYELLHVGETSLSYGAARQGPWPSADHAADASTASVIAASAHAGPGDETWSGAAQRRTTSAPDDVPQVAGRSEGAPHAPTPVPARRNWSLHLGLAGVTLVAGSALLLGLLDRLGYGRPEVHAEAVTQVLVAKGYDNLNVRSEGRGLVIKGSVASDAQRLELEDLIARRQWPARIDVRLPALSDEVSRASEKYLGIKPERVDKHPDGKVTIFTRSDKLGVAADIDRAKSVLRAAVPGLAVIEINNELPLVASSCSKKFDDPGERVTSIVWDNTHPALNTANGKSYFPGSLLPNGQRLVSIDRNRVATVECDGQRLQLVP